MKKFAVIDIGSNSVRLMLVADGKVLYKTLNTTRLGEGIALLPYLNEIAMQRTAKAVREFYLHAKSEGAEHTYIFATAAVRTAKNGSEFVKMVRDLCGLSVEVISGEEEATLGLLGALGSSDGALIDVGGASTELVVRKNGGIQYKKSINVGIVRLKDECGKDEHLLRYVTRERANQFLDAPNLGGVYAVGGTATTLAALVLGLKKYDPALVSGTRISQADMQKLTMRLLETPVAEIAQWPCVSKGREDVLAGGAFWFFTLMCTLDIQEIIVSDRDNLEGYALKKGLLQ